MRFCNSTIAHLLKPIDRRAFAATVERFDGDAYDKTFTSWDHLVALIGAQLTHARGLRALEAIFNANAQHHYHLDTGKLARSTLSDANARRPPEIFAQTFLQLAGEAGRKTRSEGEEMLRLIDSSPIPLGKSCRWATWNGRIRGMKMHVLYDPKGDVPRLVELTPATVNDIEIGKKTPIEAGATYVFDKGYCRFDWWKEINDGGALFVTRAKKNMRLRAKRKGKLKRRFGEGFEILSDDRVSLVSTSDSKLPIPLRRIKLRRVKGGVITLITNDLERTAVAIGALYKGRWEIELFFRWMKQHLDIRKFLGNNDNAIRLQILAAMIAYLLLRIAARLHGVKLPIHRFAELASQFLFSRRSIAKIDKPPEVHASRPKQRRSPNQLELCYA